MPDPTIPLTEYAARRRRLGTQLRKTLGLVMAGEPTDPLHDTFRPHPHFEYLTGVTDEPGAVLLLDPGHPVEARREVLFLRPLDPEVEKWDGYRDPVGQALRTRTGLRTIHRLGQLPRVLQDAARRAGTLACLHPLATIDRPVSPDLAVFRKLTERMPGLEIVDRSDDIPRLRSVKSAAEVKMIRRAIKITRVGFEALIRGTRPGLNEHDLQATLEHAYRTNGSRGPAFGTIVGAGLNSTVLHYQANDRPIEAGDVINVDSGAAYRGYGADITRAVPASGRFSKRQR
ncbi:MAG: aminopeptidase P N-terminal domain-containing protein, partial [Planctomycetota bacterium]